ncbi:MAG: transcription elongation factor GreB, partial [Moraxellaceae bacterium]
ALLKKQVGDEVSVVAPNGEIHYEVMGIRYK